jgi:hypothetical protein
LPDYQKVKQLGMHLQVNPGWLLFGDDTDTVQSANKSDDALLHYILKKSHYLYPTSQNNNDEYADFVLELIKEVREIDTSENNLLKIIDLAISSISSYEEKRSKQSHAI